MANPFFSGRIPNELNEKVNEYIKESGKTKTDILIEALGQYLNFPIETKKPSGDNEELWKAIKELKERVEQLEEGVIKKDVINDDNNDNLISNNDFNQLSILEETKENTVNSQNSFKGKVLEINEIPLLPGLEYLDATKLMTKVRNAKYQDRLPVKIENYLIGEGPKKPGTKRGLLWEILDDNAR